MLKESSKGHHILFYFVWIIALIFTILIMKYLVLGLFKETGKLLMIVISLIVFVSVYGTLSFFRGYLDVYLWSLYGHIASNYGEKVKE